MEEKDRMYVRFRGRCGAWVLETPDGDIIDEPAPKAMAVYVEYYNAAEMWAADPEPEEGMTCVHGYPITLNPEDTECQMCCEEFMLLQLAVCFFREGQTLAETIQFANGFIESPFSEEVVADLVGKVFSDVEAFDYLV